MKHKIKKTIIFAVFTLIAVWLYPIIQGHWATVYIPITKTLPKDKFTIRAWLTLCGAFGAAFSALIVALPLGFLLKGHSLFLGAAFGTIACVINFSLFPNLLYQFNWFVASIRIGEYTSFIAASMVFSSFGCRLRNKYTG